MLVKKSNDLRVGVDVTQGVLGAGAIKAPPLPSLVEPQAGRKASCRQAALKPARNLVESSRGSQRHEIGPVIVSNPLEEWRLRLELMIDGEVVERAGGELAGDVAIGLDRVAGVRQHW
jgi:hypothetical protein